MVRHKLLSEKVSPGHSALGSLRGFCKLTGRLRGNAATLACVYTYPTPRRPWDPDAVDLVDVVGDSDCAGGAVVGPQ